MIINIKPIKDKNNEWKPQENRFFTNDDVNTIIELEQLKTEMTCMQGVTFDAKTQVLNEVVFDCDDYHGEFIYLVKSQDIVVGREYHFAYVTDKVWDTAEKVVLQLTIDAVTSNYDLFYGGKFKGGAYLERSNNIKKEINNIHSDTCANIPNLTENVVILDEMINTNIDVFVDQKPRVQQNRGFYYGTTLMLRFDTTTYGTALTAPDNSFVAYNSTINLDVKIKEQALPEMTVQELLEKHHSWSNYQDFNWSFPTAQDILNFRKEIAKYGHDNTQLDDITRYAEQTELINSWLSIPKYFDGVDNNIISYFKFVINKMDDIDLTNHTQLHNNYYLVVGKTFKIPLDLFKIKDKTIYITRFVNQSGATFKFYYEQDRITPFYQVNLNLANGMSNNAWRDYQRELDIAYNSGAKGFFHLLPDLLANLASSGSGLLLSSLVGGSFAPLLTVASGLGLFNLFTLPFSLFQETQNEKYQRQLINSRGNESKNVLLTEALNDLVFYNTTISAYGNIYSFAPAAEGGPINSYYLITKKDVTTTGNNNLKLLVETPLSDDIHNIILDQQLFGNIINELRLDIDNILTMTENHLYWKGKILPDKNPIDNFQLDWLNEVLARGIFISQWKQQNTLSIKKPCHKLDDLSMFDE